MLDNNERMISSRYSRDSYLELNLKLDSSSSDWNHAVNIFEDRFEGRYFNVIKLLKKNIYENGFAIMSLNCLLIDALMQFRNGYPETPEGMNGFEYRKFLREQLYFNSYDATRFYEDIRCGLLHSAETKNGSYFKFGTQRMIGYGRNHILFVDINLVTKQIYNYFKRYCEELRGLDIEQDSEVSTLRANFIRKMDDITCKYEGHEIMENIWFAICSYNEEEFKLSKNVVYKLCIPKEDTNYLELQRYTERIKIKKSEIVKAIPYWPSKDAMRTLKNGEYIFMLLQRCKNLLKIFVSEEKTA